MYASDFYSSRDAATAHAAKTVLAIVQDAVPVRSVCDVGCGTGTWLKVAKSMGTEEIVGFEGAWVEDKHLAVGSEHIRRQDLEQPIKIDRRFDLAICLEVAEHLSPARGPGLVDDLCRLADAVVFSAAIPHQRGTGHVNEQWQSYWAALFKARSYVSVDIVRPRIWGDEEIPFWYRQNMLVYIDMNSKSYERLQAEPPFPAILDVVHPALYRRMEYPTVRPAVLRLARAIYRRQWR